MKYITKIIIAVIIISSIVFLSGCVDVDTPTASTPTISTDAKQDQVTPLSNKPNPKDTSSSNDTTYLDNDLKIDYPRPSGNPVLKNGSNGPEVGWLQTALNKAMYASIAVDCSFGGYTDSAVREFQARCGLSVDGAVGPQTIAMLVDIVSGNKMMPEKKKVITEPPARVIEPQTEKKTYTPPVKQEYAQTFILNVNTNVFHNDGCRHERGMKDENKGTIYGTVSDLIAQGYKPCGTCNPH